jgi:alkyl sulfatase BDS1-like metallo-beta-lactamase superfamily hydrolase
MTTKNTSLLLAGCAIILLANCSFGIETATTDVTRYMGAEVPLAEAPNGAVINAETLETTSKIAYLEPTTEKVADGVWCIGGLSIGNTTLIEGDNGLIVYDVGDNKKEGEHLLEAIRKISDKPIKVIIYSHSHYALGGGALVDNPDDVLIIGHPKLNETVEDGEELDVLGLKKQFFTEYTSDDYNLTVWIPENGVVLNNFLRPGTPNLYTLRGGDYRDPLIWRDGLKVIRDLQPEVLLSTHTRAIIGKDEVAKRLTGYMDRISLTYDQTLRGILAGLSLGDLRNSIYLPPHLAEIPENAEAYGEMVHFPEAIYQYVIGWFDGDVTKLFSVAPPRRGRATRRIDGRQGQGHRRRPIGTRCAGIRLGRTTHPIRLPPRPNRQGGAPTQGRPLASDGDPEHGLDRPRIPHERCPRP